MHTNSQENIVLCTRQLIQTLNGKNIEYYITGGVATRLVYCAHHNQTLSSSIFRNHGDIDVMVRFDALKDFLLLFSTNRYKIWYSGLQGVKNRNDIGEHHHISILDIASNVIIALFVYKQSEKFLIVLSDGEPAPSAIHGGAEYDLKTVVQTITSSTRQKILGLGIGPYTEHVARYYPNSLADVSIEQMAETIADVLRDVIERPQTF